MELCDSRSAIQHLSDWTNVGDKTSVSILKNLKELSQQHEIYFNGFHLRNDTADLLATVTENLMSRRTLTFSEIFSKKSLIQELWKTPPTHPGLDLFQSSFGVRFPEDSWAHGPGLACG
ncbi:hypothetical protein TNCV_1039381 [Trichonephila clavipes]|uniref:Uncharacterized protein n=1 Tax=Trichonephila clavipes TaxID=2585209 RepID=A0A8X6VWA9_TRICX|nr:hypothetical protein TNCV_1039381 [Trichonephila clavipes]